MADPEPPFEQRLRTEGAKQRDLHRGGHDPPHLDAAGEGSVNLTKQALRAALGAATTERSERRARRYTQRWTLWDTCLPCLSARPMSRSGLGWASWLGPSKKPRVSR